MMPSTKKSIAAKNLPAGIASESRIGNIRAAPYVSVCPAAKTAGDIMNYEPCHERNTGIYGCRRMIYGRRNVPMHVQLCIFIWEHPDITRTSLQRSNKTILITHYYPLSLHHNPGAP
jgi:hypothetical protein